jgi:hypothetical protein
VKPANACTLDGLPGETFAGDVNPKPSYQKARAKKSVFRTRRETPAFCRELGAAGHYHHVMFQPIGDAGGECTAVLVQIPEGIGEFDSAMEQARELKARVALICDTRRQAEEMAARAAEALPEHRRISLDRVEAGQWKDDTMPHSDNNIIKAMLETPLFEDEECQAWLERLAVILPATFPDISDEQIIRCLKVAWSVGVEPRPRGWLQ